VASGPIGGAVSLAAFGAEGSRGLRLAFDCQASMTGRIEVRDGDPKLPAPFT